MRAGHQVESLCTLPPKRFEARATATVRTRIFSSVQNLMHPTSAYILHISDFWYIYDLGSGQAPDLSIMSQWGKYWNPSQRISKV